MAQLPIDEAVLRFKDNESRIDKFANDPTGYTASTGEQVESIPAFLERKDAEINGQGNTILSGAQTARAGVETAQAAAVVAKNAAEVAQVGASTAKTAAEAARDSAIIGAGVYSDEATGRAAVADGQAFKVQGSGDVAAYEYRRVNSTTSTLIASYPSVSYIVREVVRLSNLQTSALGNVGISDNGRFFSVILQNVLTQLLPLVVDEDGRSVFGFDSNGRIVAELNDSTLQANGFYVQNTAYAGDKGYSFAIIDDDGRVLLAFDAAGQMVDSEHFVNGVLSEINLESFRFPIEAKYEFLIVDEDGRVAFGVDTNGKLYGIETPEPLPVADVKKHSLTFARADFNHVMLSGQSLSVGWDFTQGAILSTSQPYNNKMMGSVIDGNPNASNFSGLVEQRSAGGERGETVGSGAVNQASFLLKQELRPWENWRTDFVVSSNGVGGASIDALSKGTSPYSLGLSYATGAKSICQGLGESYKFRALFWIQGETNTGGMTESQYKTKLLQLKNDWNTDVLAITGQTDRIPMFSYQVMYHASEGVYSAFGAPVIPGPGLAQYRLAKEDAEVFLVAPMYIFPYSDGAHLTNHGYRHLGHYFGKATHKVFVEQRPWIPLWPILIKKSGDKTIDVKFYVPCPPLVFDTTLVAENVNYGFDILDSNGNARAISQVSKIAWDTIRLYCETNSQIGDVVRYAVKAYNQGIGAQVGPRGNLRDSDATISLNNGADGKPYPLYNWCVMFADPVTE